MPRLDLILLPLLGGYIFLMNFNRTKFYNQRVDKNRLIYNSLLVAFILISIVYVFDYLLVKYGTYSFNINSFDSPTISYFRNNVANVFDEIIDISSEFKKALIVLLISYPLAYLLNFNKFFKEDFSFDYTINKWGTEFDKIIWNALGEKDDLNKLLMITLKSNKVYIGHVTKLSKPIENVYVRIIPSISGYRNKETSELLITTSYTDVISRAVEEGNTTDLDKKLGIVIPVSEIILISRFDYEIFGRFNNNTQSLSENL